MNRGLFIVLGLAIVGISMSATAQLATPSNPDAPVATTPIPIPTPRPTDYVPPMWQASDACVEPSEVTYLGRYFPLFQKYDSRPLCSDKDPQDASLAEDLRFLGEVWLSKVPAGHHPIVPEPWMTYVSNRFADFETGQDSFCGANAVACTVTAWNTMFITSLFFKQGFSYQVETFNHEARHRDGDGFAHVTCLQGPAKGHSGACDRSFQEHGSYAFDLSTAVSLALRAKNINPVYQFMGASNAIATAFTRFNKVPSIKTSYALILLNRKNQILHFRNGREDLLNTVNGPGHLFNRGDYGVVYLPDSPIEPARYINFANTGSNWSSSDASSKEIGQFLHAFNHDAHFDRPNFLGFSYFGYASFELFRQRVVANCGTKKDISLALPADADSIYEIDSAYPKFLLKNGRIYDIVCAKDKTPSLQEVKDASLENASAMIKKMFLIYETYVGIDRDGHILTSKDLKAWQPVPGLENQTFVDMVVYPQLADEDLDFN